MPSSDDSPNLASVAQKFPHTRAQLAAIYRQHKGGPLEGYENNDGDESTRISTSVVTKVVTLLGDEQEDKLKELLQTNFGVDDSDMLEQHVLDLMHRHRDDVSGVPFLFLTPTKRPISRPSSRASSHSTRVNPNRPDTPASLPNSPLPIGFRRPHTPVTSPLVSGNASSYITARSVSPMHSPTLVHAQTTQIHTQFTTSLPSSPISSPRLLSAKATEFKPIQRPLSAASSNPATLSGYRTETPSPDLWSHSPLRPSSNLAIAAPLLPEQPRAVTPSSLRSSLKPGEDDDDDDPFDPCAPKGGPRGFYPITITDFDHDQWSDTAPSNSSLSPEAPSELEEALSQNGYDFEKAMAWLVDRALPPQPATLPNLECNTVGNRVAVITRDGPVVSPRGGRGYQPLDAPTGARGAPPANNRAECLRADCRFSHDLERASCRFWLRGTCAKQDQTNFGSNNGNSHPGTSSPPMDDFPALGYEGTGPNRNKKGYSARDGHWQHDPGRTRFAAAVKRPPPSAAPADRAMVTRRDQSPRIRLRSPTLLPTLPMGEVYQQPCTCRIGSRALQLGAARNACLSRAADAWRRGDGAAAKRFSREGHELNAKMSQEMAEAAGRLVRERTKLAEQASGRTILSDRSTRGHTCGGGLGICLGVAKKEAGGDGKLSSEERTEVMLDLHGLHSNEATEVLEEFLLAVAFAIVGEEKHTGMQDPARGASRARLSAGVREWLHRWGYPWNERDGVICIDPLTHS
ncbi:hypothetical protein BKA83DRAFT_451638 [Pisolithus microcarpus]|nr:hypothetical protein BKA83DRAFT_451638 [Pisolithus microcarpus]